MRQYTQSKPPLVASWILRIFGFCCLYAALGGIAYWLLSTPERVPVIWPAIGVYVAALLLTPRSRWWLVAGGIAITDFAVQNLIGGMPLYPGMALTGISTAQALLSVAAFRQLYKKPIDFEKLDSVAYFLIFLALLPPVLFAIPASFNAHFFFGAPLFEGWIWWISANSLSIAIVCPLVLIARDNWLARIKHAHASYWLETTIVYAGLIVATSVAFMDGQTPGTPLPSFSFVPFALLIWSALRLGARTTAVGSLIFVTLAIWLDTHQTELDPQIIRSGIISLELFLLVIVASTMFFVAVIQERTSDNQRLTESQQKLNTLIELSPVGIFVADKEKYLYTNPAGASIAGLTDPAAIVGESVMTFYPPEGRESAQRRINDLVDSGNGSRPRIENTIVDATGKRRNVEALASAFQWEGQAAVLIMVTDITERKQSEEALRRAQKMDAIGQLSGGIAHDFNNILGIIIGNLELVQDAAKDSPEIVRRIDLALNAVNRGSNITNKLLSFSRQKPAEMKLTTVNSFIESMQELISRSLTAAITIENQLAKDLWQVDIDPGELQDALINLALNARDAMPDGGRLIIKSRNKVLDADYVKLNPLASEGDFVLISVNDTGVGMEPDVRERIFEPFYSTKEDGKGTGLGLSMVYGFVQRSGGHVRVDTEPGKGSTFHIYLPRALRTAASANAPDRKPAALLRGTETILIVDDEVDFTDIAAHNLGFLGYTVLTASNGGEALDILNTNPYIDLLFSDVVMPGGQDGYQLAVEAHKRFPELKILLTSGYTQMREQSANGDADFLSSLASRLLRKPYNRRGLAKAIRDALDETE